MPTERGKNKYLVWYDTKSTTKRVERVAQAGGIPLGLDPDDIIHVEHNQGSIF